MLRSHAKTDTKEFSEQLRDDKGPVEVPVQSDDEPLGDRGQGDRSWKPPAGEQGISNRPDDGASGEEPENIDKQKR